MHDQQPAVRLIREKEILERTGLSRTQRWRLEREGKFPARVQLSERAFGWIEGEVEAWIAKRVSERRPAPMAALGRPARTMALPVAGN